MGFSAMPLPCHSRQEIAKSRSKRVGSKLAGRRILITGAASGIGAATARLFHEEGARLALLDRQEPALRAIARELDALALPLDLVELEAIEPAVERAAKALGGLDGVVNCAGVGLGGPIGEVTLDLLQRVTAINLTAPFLICRAALPHLQQAEGGTIVNIASGQGLLPNTPNATVYAATKGGLVNFTKALAAEAGPRVRANVICPGVTNTPMAQGLFAAYADPSDAPAVKQYALKRVADPLEIANSILFLTSADSSFVTGVALAVDGGRTFH
jgi:NAD(P)-dependent dehydrogenase (short-subunit alcohol dehydrogenase family)